MKKVVIIGATSGIGRELALKYIKAGNIVAVAGRRENLLDEIKSINPNSVRLKVMDTTKESAKEELEQLIEELNGMDLFIYCSGAGYVNKELEIEKEINTVNVNCFGFTQLINVAHHYFTQQGYGQIVNISSVAATRDLYTSPSYCSSKRYQLMYLNCIRTLARKNKKNITVTNIQPGFIDTDFIKRHNFPLTISLDKAANLIHKAIKKKKDRAYIPEFWRIIVVIWLLIPNFIWKRII